ncbi:MAG: hypothetical protein O3B87_05765, partial [bacterium]|nr:hypothetical protein [bacterium]
MNRCIYICFIVFLLFISPLSVSAQSQHIDFTQKFDNLAPRDKNEPIYAPDRIIVKYKEDQS